MGEESCVEHVSPVPWTLSVSHMPASQGSSPVMFPDGDDLRPGGCHSVTLVGLSCSCAYVQTLVSEMGDHGGQTPK
jgi:hypothetical protein